MKEAILDIIRSWVRSLQSRDNYLNAEIVEIGEDDKFVYFKIKVPKIEETEILP